MIFSKKMSIIYCCRIGVGGYGDRLVGIITCYYISKLLDKQFYIEWNNEFSEFESFLEIKKPPFNTENLTTISLIDGDAFKLIDFFSDENLEELFCKENTKVFCNQNLVYYIYMNKNYNKLKLENYENDISEAYYKIYTEFLIPKKIVKEQIDFFTNDFKNYDTIIGIHLRAGDSYIVSKDSIYTYSSNCTYLTENILIFAINVLYEWIEKRFSNYAIYIMSDYPNINIKFQEKFIGRKIFYYDKKQIHTDMVTNLDDLYEGTLKLLLDHITLTKCGITICHAISNLGKTASLISTGEKYGFGFNNIPTVEKISITDLSSKIKLI